MIPVEKKSELLLREDRPKVIICEFFNTIRRERTLARVPKLHRMWLSAALKGRKDRRDLIGEAINV
jgi:hypothetical protein